MPAFQHINRRIRSVENTKKITKAMELVSAAKMRKAIAKVLATRQYSALAWEMLIDLASRTNPEYHPLLHKRPVKKVGMLLITSNRGLCGSFNQNVVRAAADYIKWHQDQDVEVAADLVLLGKKGKSIMFHHGHTIVAEFKKLDVTARMSEILPMARMLIEEYRRGVYDKIVVAYTDYITSLRQVPRVRQILPITEKDEYLGSVGVEPQEVEEALAEEKEFEFDFLYEPSVNQVLHYLLPRLIEMQVYQAVLESDASEQSARMIAMRNATEAAGDMIADLEMAYHHARQESITAELADISGGRLAME